MPRSASRSTVAQPSSPARGPQVEPGLGVVDARGRHASTAAAAARAGAGVARPLLGDVGVVAEGGAPWPAGPATARSSRRACAPRAAARPAPGRRRRTPRGSRRGWTAWTASRRRAGPRGEPPQTRGSRMLGVGGRRPARRASRARRSTRRWRRRRRAAAPTRRPCARCSTPSTWPVGLPGLLSHNSFGVVAAVSGPELRQRRRPTPAWRRRAARRRRRSGRRPRGCRRRHPAPRPSSVGSQATSSLVPIVGSTPSGSSPGTPRRRANQAATASRRSAVPHGLRVAGGVGRLGQRGADDSGVGSTGVPTDRSTIPPGCRRALAAQARASPRGSREHPPCRCRRLRSVGVLVQDQLLEKTRDGKLLLRKVMGRYVPDDITNQVKRGFSGPDASWFRGDSLDYRAPAASPCRPMRRSTSFLDPAGVLKPARLRAPGGPGQPAPVCGRPLASSTGALTFLHGARP